MNTLKVPVTNKDHIQGNFNSKITLLEYGDFQCPACGSAFPIIKQVQKYFSEQLRFVFRNFPISEIHPLAEVAAETSEFAAAYKKFWEMHDLIYTNQRNLTLPLLFDLADMLDLPKAELETALEFGKYSKKVTKELQGGIKSGVQGTPTLFINGEKHEGPYDFDSLITTIKKHL